MFVVGYGVISKALCFLKTYETVEFDSSSVPLPDVSSTASRGALVTIPPAGKHKLPRRERPAKVLATPKKGYIWKEQSILSRYASELTRSHEVAEERKAKRHQEAEAARIKLRQELADAERQRQRKQHNYWSW